MKKALLLIFCLIIPFLSVNAQLKTALNEDFSNTDKFLDLSKLILWNDSRDTASAFSIQEVKDDGNKAFRSISLKPEAMGEGGYNSGSAYTSTCIDYVLPLYNRSYDTLVIEFDFLSEELSGSGENGRLGIATIYQYPPEGPSFNDVYDQEKDHPFGRPAYNLRLLNKNDNGNGAYLFYGGGDDILGEFEQTGEDIWLPGFISGPGGFAPGQKENYPEGPVLETTEKMVSEQYWQHYTWMITPENLLVYQRASGEDNEKDVLKINMYLPGGETDNEIIQKLNDFYESNLTQLPELYNYFDRIEALRFYFRSVKNGYLANIKVSKTDNFIPAAVAFNQDTLQIEVEEDYNSVSLPLNVANPMQQDFSFDIVVNKGTGILEADTFSFNQDNLNNFDLSFSGDYQPDEEADTLNLKIAGLEGWVTSASDKLLVIIKKKTVTANPVFAKNDITFYPNPVNDFLYSNSDQILQVKIYNLQQRLVLIKEFKYELNVKNLAPGMYVAHIQNGESKMIFRIVKK